MFLLKSSALASMLRQAASNPLIYNASRTFAISSGIGGRGANKNVVTVATQSRVIAPNADLDGKKARAQRELEESARQHRMLRGMSTPEDLEFYKQDDELEAELLKRVEAQDGKLFANYPFLLQFTAFTAVLTTVSIFVYVLFMREDSEHKEQRVKILKQEMYRTADERDALQREMARKILADAGLSGTYQW